jgi:superfamily II DNA or RNA helicase
MSIPEKSILPVGLYETLLDAELQALMDANPDLIPTLVAIDDEASPHTYSQFVGRVIKQALRITKKEDRLNLVNRLIELLSAQDGLKYTQRKHLLERPKSLLREIRRNPHTDFLAVPSTPMSVSSLLTGAGDDPQLEHEIRAEMMSADRVDILVSFIKWSGLRLLIPAFEDLARRNIPVRIITTSYMGASDAEAVEWLARQDGFAVKVSYDTTRTRLHAKAYHFFRKSGLSTAYIGSANMSAPAMTSGVEWTVKVTAQDMLHVLERFTAEFETYWAKDEFEAYNETQIIRFREALEYGRGGSEVAGPRFFAEIKPHSYQQRILENLEAAREAGSMRNLVCAATGTGKTVIAAFDFARYLRAKGGNAKLLFVVHRKEILQQARDCFRTVLRDPNLGELLVDGAVPNRWECVFASVLSLNNRSPWQTLGAEHFDFIIVDEAHHGTASSYRSIFEKLRPEILLGLTATPERMDGSSILPDFGNVFAAEIRLPEALEEKLLCPFHYFGVTDPVDISSEAFWSKGKYDQTALENVYTGDDFRALQRLDVIMASLARYQPDLSWTRAVGFCAGVEHAKYMARKFKERGLKAEVLLGDTNKQRRDQLVADFRKGDITFLFVVDVFSEGVDIPEINLVLFLRPTESITVFLQQLGRGLRHSPEKDCLTVLDFVGQSHRKYRIDQKFAALLRSTRRRIDREIESDFPNLPPGCSIQLERVAREHILKNITDSLGNLNTFIPEVIRTFESENKLPLTFGNFIDSTGLCPIEVLNNRTWSEWKARADGTAAVTDPDLKAARSSLKRMCLRTDSAMLDRMMVLSESNVAEDPSFYGYTDEQASELHYLLWAKKGQSLGVGSYRESFEKWLRNTNSVKDMVEVIQWRKRQHRYPTKKIEGPLHLHAAYGSAEIKAAFGLANLQRSGAAGVGVIPVPTQNTYIHLVTFRKEDRDFAPTTRYKDYLISPDLLHWESQAGTSQNSRTGQNYINFVERGYKVLFFARLETREGKETSPFIFLGPATELISYEGNRPISMVWRLQFKVPAELFEISRAV